jgi:hypothetical protein
MTYIETFANAEIALENAKKNIVLLNEICRENGLPPLTAEKAVECYFHPEGNWFRDFSPNLPDLGSNNAGAFGDIHHAKWQLTVVTSCGPKALEVAYKAQNAAFYAFFGHAAILQEVRNAYSALSEPVKE